jgi:NAD(P)-dependent dehydrogenase (short-subunit alcohol dehydrogenase family)
VQITSPHPTPFIKVDFDQFLKVQNVNTNGTFLVLNIVSAAMATQEPVANDETQPGRGTSRGSIVNLGSVVSFSALTRGASYTTSKHAVLGLTRAAGESPYVANAPTPLMD